MKKKGVTKVRYSRPPRILLWLITLFVGAPPKDAVYTLGSTVYAPGQLTVDLLAHEETHTQQQGRLPIVWWVRWLTSTQFRLQQEGQAYAAQMRCIRNRSPRRYHLRALDGLSRTLAGGMYGGLCTQERARTLIWDRTQ